MPVPQLPHRRSPIALRRAKEGENLRTILIALGANVVIAVAKLVAGLVSGSTGMLAEAAHSTADSINEVLLGISLYREKRPPDADHPLGHGGERFLWALLAALASFLIGGCVSVFMAVRELAHRHPIESTLAAWIVLAIAFLADGTSWLQSMRQAKRQAEDYSLSLGRYLVRASDPVVRAVVFEDSTALIGVVIAAFGLLISQVTGSNVPDSIASLLIGILLAITAFGLARPLADFLVGRSMPPEQLEELQALFRNVAAIDQVLAVRTFYTAPEEVLVVAKVYPSPELSIDQLATAMDELDLTIRERFPIVADVYIDVTTRRAG